jgi:16S rRNA (adenine1518-N6/adenine1519-N6)-dimethyltransferase
MGVQATLDAHGLRPQKKWGQNFLTDARILESIADAADLGPTDSVLEIGPGLGHLTRVLARRARHVVAVEIDRALAAKLTADFVDTPSVKIIHGDILQWEPIELFASGHDPASATPSFKIVANLPYYITSAILRHVLETAHPPQIVVVMVQREVAQRMIAKPPSMSLLAVSVQFFAQVRVVRTISAGAFYPRPKVDSAVVRLDVLDPPRQTSAETKRFFEMVHAGFGGRRKQLRNSLARGLAIDPDAAARALVHAQIDPTRRAETLTLDEWSTLQRELPRRSTPEVIV